MDIGLELSEKGRRRHQEIEADDSEDEELESDILDHPVVRFQNNCFLLALLAGTLCFAVYVVSNVYFSENAALQDEYGGASSVKTAHATDWADAAQKHAAHHHTKGKPKDYNHKAKEIAAWQNATVSLQDGVKYKILDQLVHDNQAFTEGLTMIEGRLFESVGLYQQSQLRELDPETGEIIDAWMMDSRYFGEGLTYVDGKLIQLTYKRKPLTGFIYNFTDMSAQPSTFNFQTSTGQGWGMTYDSKRKEIVVSDGSDFLLMWDPETMQEKRRVKVTRQLGKSARQINELEYWRDRILANVWYEDTILVINPDTGQTEKEYDFRDLYPGKERSKNRADVLNGISVSSDPDILFVTGKLWDRMFKIKLLH